MKDMYQNQFDKNVYPIIVNINVQTKVARGPHTKALWLEYVPQCNAMSKLKSASDFYRRTATARFSLRS